MTYDGVFPKTPEYMPMPDQGFMAKMKRKADTPRSWAAKNPDYSYPALCTIRFISRPVITRRDDPADPKPAPTESYAGALKCFAKEFNDM